MPKGSQRTLEGRGAWAAAAWVWVWWSGMAWGIWGMMCVVGMVLVFVATHGGVGQDNAGVLQPNFA